MKVVSLALFGIAALAAGCVQSSEVRCSNGLVCPADHTCDEARNRCIAPNQTQDCEDLAEGAACMFAGVPGSCVAGVCEPNLCGDGQRTPGEECDGLDFGDQSCVSLGYYEEGGGLACRADCTRDESACVGACGDQIKNGPELCDGDDVGTATCTTAGFYEPIGLKCSPFCTYDVTDCLGQCGDGIENGAELCDGAAPEETCIDVGLDVGRLTCSTACGFSFAGCGRIGWQFETSLLSNGGGDPYFVHGSSASNLWAVGDEGQVAHFDGNAWTRSIVGNATPTFRGVFVADLNAAWAVDGGNVWRWNGTSWDVDATAPSGATAVWGTSATDVWITTTGSGVKRWSGSTWADVGGIADAGLVTIHGSSVTDVWISTSAGSVRRWNGATWSVATTIAASLAVRAVHVIAQDDVWVVGYSSQPSIAAMHAHWNGSQWTVTRTNPNDEYFGVTASAANDVWISNYTGVAHFDGHGWTAVPAPVPSPMRLFELSPQLLIGVTSDGAYRHEGLVYAENTPPASSTQLTGIASTRDGHIFIRENASASIRHYDGTSWTTNTLPGSNPGAVYTVVGNTVDATWAGASSGAYKFTGSGWQQFVMASPIQAIALWVGDNSNVWAVGNDGDVRHYNGTSWIVRDIPGWPTGFFPTASSGSGANDVWVQANNGRTFRWNGSTWSDVSPPTIAGGLVVVAPNRAIVTAERVAYHYNGTTWVEVPLPKFPDSPSRLAAVGPDYVFGISDSQLFHYDGVVWSRVRLPFVAGTRNIALAATPNRVDILSEDEVVRSVLRTTAWQCAMNEVGACDDAVDNDCDGRVDTRDPDCP